MNPYFKEYSEFLKEIFPGRKMQKISVNTSFGCPNRDGTLGVGGCIYCNNSSFTPAYCLTTDTLEEQLGNGKKFFSRKYPEMRYLAYFQSYTSTYKTKEEVLSLFKRALACSDVEGIIVGTRPDCIDRELMMRLAEINREYPVIMEFGAESSNDKTLKEINRHHTWEQTCNAVELCREADIKCGLHLICGLPGEDNDVILKSVKEASDLPIHSIKFHQLQVIKGTELERRWKIDPNYITPFTVDGYLSLCEKIVRMVPRKIAIERFVSQSPSSLLVAPRWGLKNFEFTNLLLNKLNKSMS